tara:strand:- start:1312 stop:1518 length:207 start_codon:yes stop_codon:yes gene_type:complete
MRLNEIFKDKAFDVIKELFYRQPWLLKGCSEQTLAKVLEVYTREEQMYMLARLDIKAMFHSKAKKNEH